MYRLCSYIPPMAPRIVWKARGPGLKGKVTSSETDAVIVTADDDGKAIEVQRTVAETVTVRADPAPPPRAALPEQLVISADRYGR